MSTQQDPNVQPDVPNPSEPIQQDPPAVDDDDDDTDDAGKS